MSPIAIADAWRKFKQDGDLRARSDIIDQYSYLVRITAGRVVSNMPSSLERDDLVSAGAMGLIKAVDQFDASRQVKFETYAIALIRGAILEMLREEDWVPRSIRERLKTLEQAYLSLETSLGRPPSEHEVARELGMTNEDFNKLLLDTGRTSLVSLDDILVGGDNSEKLHLADVVSDDRANTAGDVEDIHMKRSLVAGVDRLPERERLVIALYYYEGLTFKEIGRILSVSESRVYQLHTQAVIRMRGYLKSDIGLFRQTD